MCKIRKGVRIKLREKVLHNLNSHVTNVFDMKIMFSPLTNILDVMYTEGKLKLV